MLFIKPKSSFILNTPIILNCMVYRLPFDKGNRRKGRSFNNPPSVARGGNPKDWVNSGYAITPCLSFRKLKNKS